MNIGKEISYTKAGQTRKIEDFDMIVDSEMFDFVGLTTEIINQEVNCACGTESLAVS